MNEEKRKIGEYTVLCSVNVGEKEVILASNEQSTNGDKYMCGFAERNDLFELCSECRSLRQSFQLHSTRHRSPKRTFFCFVCDLVWSIIITSVSLIAHIYL